jgi:hypothetical protein
MGRWRRATAAEARADGSRTCVPPHRHRRADGPGLRAAALQRLAPDALAAVPPMTASGLLRREACAWIAARMLEETPAGPSRHRVGYKSRSS